jgi:hypothetical protein
MIGRVLNGFELGSRCRFTGEELQERLLMDMYLIYRLDPYNHQG